MSERTERRVRRVLEHELAGVDTPQQADRVLERAETLAGSSTEAEQASQVKERHAAAASAVADAARGAPGTAGAAAALVETAAQAVAPTRDAEAVVRGAQAALGSTVPSPPAADRGRVLLQEAALRRMGRRDTLDAQLFLFVNGQPHPGWLDRVVDGITLVFRGGWVWMGAVLIARLLGARCTGPALAAVVPCVVGATAIVEYPVKALFRRRRPFVDVIRAIVVGKKPGSWSFPSGHTASSFAAATALAGVWPRLTPLFVTVAAIVGLSRVYAGAHYPGDVLTGAFMGTTIAGAIRTVVVWLLRSRLDRSSWTYPGR